ncbi:hypothetical protein Hanom_Chr00s000003g01604001 [Helianthus anomalus]
MEYKCFSFFWNCSPIYLCLFLPAVVKPMLDSFEPSKKVRQPALNDVVAGMTGKNQ